MLLTVALVPLVDQSVKTLLRRRLGSRAEPLGPLGSIRLERAHTWIARLGARDAGASLAVWLAAAIALVLVSSWFPASPPFAGLLLGGSLSHAVESVVKGEVTDYVCLRFWPSFNLADVAITIGGIGVVVHAMALVRGVA